jgi:hypothetical protein
MKLSPSQHRHEGLRAHFAAGVLALAFTACGAPEESPVGYRGERVVVYTDFGPVCAGTVARFDQEIARIDAALELDNDTYITEVWILGDDIYDRCPRYSGGCAPMNRAYVHFGYMEVFAHEAVHTRVYPTGGNAGKALFTEGIAEALSRPSCYDEERMFSSPDSYIEPTYGLDLPDHGYYLGGELVSWLLRTHGPHVVLEFMRTIDRHATPAEFSDLYTSMFGSSFDEDLFGHLRPLDAEYEPWERGCDAPDAAPDEHGRGYAFGEILDCDSPRVENDFLQLLFDVDDRAFVMWSITVTEANAGYFTLSGEMPPTGGVTLTVCDCVWANARYTVGVSPPPFTTRTLRPGDEVLLPPNRYRARWSETLGGALDVRLSPACSVELDDCPLGQQCTIWNRCEPAHDVLAQPGESCETLEGIRTCVSGSRCAHGTCVLECGPSRACPEGEVCGQTRLCGPACDLLGQDCGEGWSCILLDAIDGTGQCAPAGGGELMDPCHRLDDVCGSGLVCGSCGPSQLEGCCVPLCESDADCPAEVPLCAFAPGAGVGVCV